ncbi:MAG: hypothetical protein JO364_02950 [Pseudonocardiales bacterium]|nr:hypothetical protein [Pseudonocardiales bacterium]
MARPCQLPADVRDHGLRRAGTELAALATALNRRRTRWDAHALCIPELCIDPNEMATVEAILRFYEPDPGRLRTAGSRHAA